MTHASETVDSDTFVLSIGGLRIAARTTGSGDPVLLLNGMSRPMKSWASFAGALRDRTVIAFDAPGVGASETPVVPYSMPMLSDVAARVLDAVGIEKAVDMPDSVYRVTDVIGVSTESWEAAARNAVQTAAATVRDLRVAEVVRQDVVIENGQISGYRVRLALSFKYDSGD